MFRAFAVVACATAAALGAYAAPAAVRAFAPASVDVARVPRAADGHYWAQARVGGRRLPMLVDTGAGMVALTRHDAEALGLEPDSLRYERPVVTAAGRAQGASVILAELSVGDAVVTSVPALVVRDGLEHSLLGMSYLGRLKGFSADAKGLTLTR